MWRYVRFWLRRRSVEPWLCRLLDDISVLAPPENRLPKWDLGDARSYVARVEWRFARTMPQSPHYYTVRAKRPGLTRDFLAFAQLIHSRGVLKAWVGYVRSYLEVRKRPMKYHVGHDDEEVFPRRHGGEVNRSVASYQTLVSAM